MFGGRGALMGALVFAFSSLGFASVVFETGPYLTITLSPPVVPQCVPGWAILSGTLSQGATLSRLGDLCTEGIYTFSNFMVYGASIPSPITNPYVWTLSLGPATNAAGLDLDFASHTGLDMTGDVFQISFTITPGDAPVTEFICSTPIGASGSCSGSGFTPDGNFGALNGGSLSNVTLAGTDLILGDPPNAASVISPEPMTLPLAGMGLATIGFLGRKKLRRENPRANASLRRATKPESAASCASRASCFSARRTWLGAAISWTRRKDSLSPTRAATRSSATARRRASQAPFPTPRSSTSSFPRLRRG